MDQNKNDSKPHIWISFLKSIILGIQIYNKSITKSLILFKKPRKMTNDFFNNCIFANTFQWTSFFLISDFLAEILKANKNQQKR